MNPYYLAEQSVFKSFFYLAEAMQYYWPSANYEISENNMALHLARAFSENGFLVWAEVPFNDESKQKLDFLAYHYPLKTLVALELKNNIEQPEKNYEDINRVVRIYDNGVYNVAHRFNNQSITEAEHKIVGVATILNATEYAEWWINPTNNEYLPVGRNAEMYRKIGMAINVAPYGAAVPLCEDLHEEADIRYRFRRAAYALYDAEGVAKLKAVLK